MTTSGHVTIAYRRSAHAPGDAPQSNAAIGRERHNDTVPPHSQR